ncbi:Uncharacterised protein [Mycobacteroides abscessus subsp. abscessus]|nr:Uncharacterised protein [Mycobacteroides abscessus subsp. abscessus]
MAEATSGANTGAENGALLRSRRTSGSRIRFTVLRSGPPSSALSTSTPSPIARQARSITARRGSAERTVTVLSEGAGPMLTVTRIIVAVSWKVGFGSSRTGRRYGHDHRIVSRHRQSLRWMYRSALRPPERSGTPGRRGRRAPSHRGGVRRRIRSPADPQAAVDPGTAGRHRQWYPLTRSRHGSQSHRGRPRDATGSHGDPARRRSIPRSGNRDDFRLRAVKDGTRQRNRRILPACGPQHHRGSGTPRIIAAASPVASSKR